MVQELDWERFLGWAAHCGIVRGSAASMSGRMTSCASGSRDTKTTRE